MVRFGLREEDTVWAAKREGGGAYSSRVGNSPLEATHGQSVPTLVEYASSDRTPLKYIEGRETGQLHHLCEAPTASTWKGSICIDHRAAEGIDISTFLKGMAYGAIPDEYGRSAHETEIAVGGTITSGNLYFTHSRLTSDANDDIGVLNSGQITADSAGVRVRLLMVWIDVSLGDTAGAAGAEISSNDATPVDFFGPYTAALGSTIPRQVDLKGNKLTTSVNKHFRVIGGGAGGAGTIVNVYAWYVAV
jgi:hypothetical protein